MNVQTKLIGDSEAMAIVRALIRKVAPTEATVLVSGESGSGKELVAQEIHDLSPRCGAPFVAINCGAIPGTLIEAELFGFERGSFTGATRNHRGVVERASGGTLFLDEVTEMSGEMQARLLRVLETRRYFRVGGSEELRTDIRIIAATNRCPMQAVRDGLLREDLFYRLAVFPIAIAPLRDRGNDVVTVAKHILDDLNHRRGTSKSLAPSALSMLADHNWPGNVRELKNAVERAFILGDELLTLEPLAPAVPAREPDRCPVAGPGLSVPIGSSLADAERCVIQATLAHWRGNKSRTAKVLGCSLKTLYNKLALYQQEQVSA
jgi:transcriptional regulator with PAS, ATPase and Fis domain